VSSRLLVPLLAATLLGSDSGQVVHTQMCSTSEVMTVLCCRNLIGIDMIFVLRDQTAEMAGLEIGWGNQKQKIVHFILIR